MFERRDDPGSFAQVEALWQAYLDASREVTLADRDSAPRVAATNAARDWIGKSTQTASVLEAVLLEPDNFTGTAFAFADHNIEPDDLEAANRGYKKEFQATPKSHRRSQICTIDSGNLIDDVFRTAARIINFWFGKGPGLYAYHDIVRIEHDDFISYYGRRSWPNVSRAVGLAHLKQDVVWKADNKAARRLAKLENQRQGRRYVGLSADALSEEIARRVAF